MMQYHTYARSPLGTLLLTSDGAALTGLYLSGHPDGFRMAATGTRRDTAFPFAETRRQIAAYFAGRLTAFTLPLAPRGTEFQRRVWDELACIPYGTTCTYGEIARRLGQPNACRAVGLANGRNPVSVIIPCHRVLGASGRLTGYSGGLACKQILLALEQKTPGLF